MTDLGKLIQDRSARVGIIGLGYVGLPLANAFIRAGFHVLGVDTDPAKIEKLNAGQSYIKHLPSETIAQWRQQGRFEATSDSSRMNEPDVLLICVPTPLTDARDPDLQYVTQTAKQIAAVLRPGQLVVLESTTYPTTTRDVLLPILNQSGLTCGQDYFLAYSPEREDPGNAQFSAERIPKVVGGIDETSLTAAVTLYEQAIVQVIPVSSAEVAEACKILENTYRAVNIALVNELKILYDKMGIDVWEVIEAAKTKPFGFQAFYPGPGLGGHCIPIDPFYLSWLARKEGLTTRFIELAGEVNSGMPDYVVARVSEFLNEQGKPLRGARICLLGMAYKKDVDDPRESPSFVLLEKLLKRGAEVTYHDPHIPVLPKMRHHQFPEMNSVELTPEFLQSQDAVLIATDHTNVDYEAVVRHAPLVIDTRNATRAIPPVNENIRRT